MPGPALGRQLPGSFAAGGIGARLYERGLALDSPSGEVIVHFAASLGRPEIRTGPGPQTLQSIVQLTATAATSSQAVPLVRSALQGRLSVRPVGPGPATTVALSVEDAVAMPGDETHAVPLTALGLVSRQLYDVVLQLDGSEPQAVAPHAVYYRDDWRDFGLAHITDMHVARRIDRFRELLREAGKDAAADKIVNWNDRFRGFVRFANQLHDEGRLDLIVATGDLYDYIYETDDDPESGGNAEFLAQLITGQAPGPEFPDVEELRVPMCVVPGNHDYRRNPYRLTFAIQVAGIGLKQVTNYQGYGIGLDDATTLDQRLRGHTHGEPFELLDGFDSGSMVEVDRKNLPYERFLGKKGSYVLSLGPHRVVMLDTGPDTGIVDDVAGAARSLFGLTSEDENTFVGGSPNCEGVEDMEFSDAVQALDDAAAGALVILGMHAPLINTPSNEYPYFMRETQRPAQDAQPAAWVGRVQSVSLEDAPAEHPTWFPADRDHRDVRFIKRGSSLEGLDFGVARGHGDELLQRIAGIGAKRPADLVLGGHTHRHNEFRVSAASGELQYFLDFYTSNPGSYYPTRYWTSGEGDGPYDDNVYPVTYVDVVEGAHEASSPWTPPDGRLWDKIIQVPPYAKPLDRATDKRQWWAEHRPLIVQTSSLGPVDNPHSSTSFCGFRLVSVVEDVIDNVHFVPMKRLEANGWALPFEEAIRAEGAEVLPFFGRTEQFRLARADSSPAGCVVPESGSADIYYRDADGNLMQLWRDSQARWGFSDLTALAQGAPAAAGDPRAHLDTSTNTVHLLYRGTDANIHCLYWATTGGVGHDNLSGAAGAPAAASSPLGWYRHETKLHHVVYRSDDGHLHTLYWSGAQAAQHEDLTASAGLPASAGDPSAYFGGGYNIVAFRGQDGHMYTTYWSDGAAAYDDLSTVVGTPAAAGDPTTTYIGESDLNHVIYRGQDGNLHALCWVSGGATTGRNLTSDAGAPLAASDPAAFYTRATKAMHVVYRTADDHVIDLTWTPGKPTTTYVDLTEIHRAPTATMKPAAYVFGANSTEHVAFRSKAGHIYEFVTPYAKLVDDGSGTGPGGPGGTVVIGGPVIR